jgi:hypothetical protein
MCGSVGASRAGNPEEGGSSWVGGKVCLLVEMWDWVMWDWGVRDWEVATLFFLNIKKNKEKIRKLFYGLRP